MIDPNDLARFMWRKDYDANVIYNFSEYRAIVYRTADAFQLAGQYGPEHDAAPDVSSYPRSPLQPQEGEQFSYRVVVEVVEGSHRIAGGALTIGSGMSLTYGEIRDLAIESVLRDAPDNRYRNSVGSAINIDRDVNVYVIAASRT